MKVELVVEKLGTLMCIEAADLVTALGYAYALCAMLNMDLLRACGLKGEVMITGVQSKMNDEGFVIADDE